MKKALTTLLSLLLVLMLTLSVGLAETVEPSGEGPASVSNITSVMEVPLITLNNGVQVPQLGLGTQIQSLERDSSEAGRTLLNSTSHDAVLAALQAGYHRSYSLSEHKRIICCQETENSRYQYQNRRY